MLNKEKKAADTPDDKKADERDSTRLSEEKPKKRRFTNSSMRIEIKIGLLAALVIIIASVLFGSHVVCVHSWEPRTCTEPKTCTICGAKEGKPHGHEWAEATCDMPVMCVYCGKTKGKALGHEWQEATCTMPKSCSRCGATVGKALGHDLQEWTTTKEASCIEEGQRESVCTRCGEIQAETIAKLEHTPGEWQVTQDVTITSTGVVVPGTQEQKCTVCGTTLNTQSYTIEVTTSQRNALLKAASYLRMGGFSYKSLQEQLEYEGFSAEDSSFACDHCGADWMVQAEQKARSYMKFMSFSRAGLIEQLEFEGFTAEQASHGADTVGL